MSQPGTTAPAPLSNADQIIGKIVELQESLQQNLPNYQGLLHVIHSACIKDENLTHMLSEEQIGILIAGLCKHKGVVLAQEATKKGTGGKKLKNLTLDDL